MSDKPTKPPAAPVGAPRKLKGGRRVNVYLDDASIAEAERLGAGIVSEGIRIALQRTAAAEPAL